MHEHDDRDPVAAALRATAPPDVSPGFLAGVNARIDAAEGWLGVADFRVWTLRLAPIAAVLAMLALFGGSTSSSSATTSTTSTTSSTSATTAASTFVPSRASDWQRDVSANALLRAALGIEARDVQ